MDALNGTAAAPRQGSAGRRRGDVFAVRITPEERAALEAARANDFGSPRALGPYLVWKALDRINAQASLALERVVPAPGPGSARTAVGVLPELSERIVLDLCGGSGSWSAPYREAGYDVRLVTFPESDVRLFVPPADVWGVLAAPPCTEFSLAKNGHERDFVEGMECVNACLRIVFQCRPRWWALENPVGHLSKWLGVPRDEFQPCDFGDTWTKRTALWGDFATPARQYRSPLTGMPGKNAAERAVTPPGFARAFFAANP